MGISDYLSGLRSRIGHDLVLVAGATALVLDDDDRLLVQLRSDNGEWGLPGGVLDPGEAPAQAAVREAYEETGLVVRPERLAGVVGPHRIVYPNGDQVEVTTSAFVCRVIGGRLGSLDGESAELRFVSLDDLPTSPFLAPYPLAELLDGASSGWFAWEEAWLPSTEGEAG